MNVTLISANSYRIINDEIKKIIKDNHFLTINMNQSNINDILDEASYFSFMDEKKYIVVNNADFFGTSKITDEDSKKIQSYLENPNPNTILIFTTLNGIDLRKKIVKTIKEKGNLIVINPWDKKKIREEADKYLNKYNYNADYNTISYIIENTYNNIDILYNELDKIMLFYNNPCTLNLNDIVAIVGKEVDNNNFHFVSAVIEKDLEKSISLMKSLKIYKVESIVLINLLAREYRLMYYVKRLKDKKLSIGEMCKELNLQEWQVTKLYNNSLKYSESEILKNLYSLGEIDLNIKNGTYDKDCALYSFLLDACI